MKSNQTIDIEMIFRIKIPFSGAFQFEREKFVMNGSGAVALYVEEWGGTSEPSRLVARSCRAVIPEPGKVDFYIWLALCPF